MIERPAALRLCRELIKQGAAQHQQDFLGAGEKYIYIRQRRAKDSMPVSTPRRAVWIRHGKIEGSGNAHRLDAPEDRRQLGAIICVHALHERRVTEVKEPHLFQRIVAYIVRAKNRIAARGMYQHAGGVWGAENYRVPTVLSRHDGHPLR